MNPNYSSASLLMSGRIVVFFYKYCVLSPSPWERGERSLKARPMQINAVFLERTLLCQPVNLYTPPFRYCVLESASLRRQGVEVAYRSGLNF